MSLSRIFIVSISTLVAATAAWAWIPPSFHIVQTLAKKHDGLNAGRFYSRISLLKTNGELVRTFNETLVFTDAEHVTSRLTDEAGNEVATRSRKLIGTRASDLTRPVLYDLMFVKDKESVFDHLKALGLTLKTESELYAEKEGSVPYKSEPYVAWLRYENRVAAVVGDVESAKKAKVATQPQLWIEKGSYLPLRAYFTRAAGSVRTPEPIEFRFSGYQPYRTGFQYPRTINVLVDGNPWIRIETTDVRLGEAKPLEPLTAKGEPASGAKEFAEKYFEWIR